MPETALKLVDELINKVNLRKVKHSHGKAVPGLQISLRGPQEILNTFFTRLDASPALMSGIGTSSFPLNLSRPSPLQIPSVRPPLSPLVSHLGSDI